MAEILHARVKANG